MNSKMNKGERLLLPLLLSFFLFFYVNFNPVCSQITPIPLVVMHGITENNQSMTHIVEYVQQLIPNIYVVAPDLGGWWLSVFRGMPEQLELLCSFVKQDPKLKNGFNLMGTSQGGVLARGKIRITYLIHT